MMTHGRTAFADPATTPRFSPLEGDASFDVVIVGAGITGLMTARILAASSGFRVAVLEAGHVGGGATSFSTGQLTSLVDAGYAALESDFGAEQAKAVATATARAMRLVEEVATEDEIVCALRRVPTVLFAETDEQARDLEREAAAAVRAGLAVQKGADALLPFATTAVYRLDDQLDLDPAAFVQGLARSLTGSAGAFGTRRELTGSVEIFEHTRVLSIEDQNPVVVRTNHGVVRASWVVEATHVPGGRNTFHARTAPYRSYVVAARPGPVSLEPGIYADTAEPYHYLREHEGLVLCGGEDHKAGQRASDADPFTALETHLRARLGVLEVVKRWTTELYTTLDGLPYIGPVGAGSRHLVATGFDGDGLLFGALAGELLSQHVLGVSSTIGEILTPLRVKPIASAGTFVKEQVNVAFHLVGDRVKSAPEGADHVALGEGAVVDLEGTRCAVYRDEAGKLHVRSATCPHMGCVVQWNGDAKTFDCPCHGGCFSAYGKVLGGPPATDLPEVDITPRDAEPIRVRAATDPDVEPASSIVPPMPLISAHRIAEKNG